MGCVFSKRGVVSSSSIIRSTSQVSSIISTNHRTEFSNHRTKPFSHMVNNSNHRINLSNHRTKPFNYMVNNSNHRTNLSNHKTKLFNHTTKKYCLDKFSNFFNGKKGNILHEIIFIIAQFILIIIVSIALLSYTNNVATDLGFEKRVSSLDLALITTTVFGAPGTLKFEYNPLAYDVPVSASFSDSIVHISEINSQLEPTIFWYLSNANMDMFRGSVSLQGTMVDDVLEPTTITFYKAGRQISFSEDGTNPFQLICPSINTSVQDIKSKKLFFPRMFISDEDYNNFELPANRIEHELWALNSDRVIHESKGSPLSSHLSQSKDSLNSGSFSEKSTSLTSSNTNSNLIIPSDSNIVIALGDSGEQREPGSLVVYFSADNKKNELNILKARKLACLVINELLAPDTSVFYAQVMPIFTNNLDSSSNLNILKENSNDDQVLIFVDISNFGISNIDVTEFSNALLRAIERYYGRYDFPPSIGAPISFTVGSGMVYSPDYVTSSILGTVYSQSSSTQSTDSVGQVSDVSIEGDTPVRRMFSVCSSKPLDLSSGLESLKSVSKVWIEESLNDGAVYVRGGQTKKSSLECTNNGQADWIVKRLRRFFPALALPCDNSQCVDELRNIYQTSLVDPLEGHYLCGDCGTYLVQMYACAFGKLKIGTTHPKTAPVVAATKGVIKGYNNGRPVKDKSVWGSKSSGGYSCWDDVVVKQLGGKLQFGDVIEIPGHYVMYVGGIGLDYEIVEMGAWGFDSAAGIQKAKIGIQFNGKSPSGIRVIKDAKLALSSYRPKKVGCIIHRVSDVKSERVF